MPTEQPPGVPEPPVVTSREPVSPAARIDATSNQVSTRSDRNRSKRPPRDIEAGPATTTPDWARTNPGNPIVEGNLPDDLRQRVGALRVSSHSYTDVPEERVVYVGGQRHQSGDQLAAGIMLSEITDQGLIVEIDGLLVTIDLLERWKL